MSDAFRVRRPVEADHAGIVAKVDDPWDGRTIPNDRRTGLGRALYDRFIDDVRGRRVRRVIAVA